MSGLIFGIDGLDDIERFAAGQQELVHRVAGATLYRLADEVMTDSAENYVPVRDGILRDSRHVELPRRAADGATEVQAGYGGAAAAYAAVQHERLDFNHPNGGEAKFLEKPAIEHSQHMGDLLSEDLRIAFEAEERP